MQVMLGMSLLARWDATLVDITMRFNIKMKDNVYVTYCSLG